MDIDTIVKIITDKIERYDNKDNYSWNYVFKNEIKFFKDLSTLEKNLVLIRVVREITRRGYSILDNPFRLAKY